MSRIECVIFDWAGTTVDFGSLSPVSAFREAFRSFCVEVTEEETRAPMGMLKIDHIRTMLAMPRVAESWQCVRGHEPTEADAQAIYERFEPALMAVLDRHCDLKPGLIECVNKLRERHIKIGSTTGFTRAMMDIVEPVAKAAGYAPDATLTADDVGGLGRPWPYMVFENMKRLGVSSVTRVVKVGDTVSDIKEAIAAGVIPVGVIEGSSIMGLSRAEWDALTDEERQACRDEAREAFERAGARFVINRLDELPALIETMEVA